MAGGFPKVPALLAACFARCCTAPLCSLICHCVHLLSLPSLSLCLPRRSQPCCRVLQFYVGPKPALVVCFLPSVIRVHAQIWSLWFPLLDVNGLGHGYGGMVTWSFHSFQNSRTSMSNIRFVATWSSNTRAGKSARLSRCRFSTFNGLET